MQCFAPNRVPGRSACFDQWLHEQPDDVQREIAAQEQRYALNRSTDSVEERVFQKSMIGFEDLPAGGLTSVRTSW